MRKPDDLTARSKPLVPAVNPGGSMPVMAEPPNEATCPALPATAADQVDTGVPSHPMLAARPQQPHLDAELQAVIGRQLRAVYHEILNEPVPDRFVRLLEELAAKAADQR